MAPGHEEENLKKHDLLLTEDIEVSRMEGLYLLKLSFGDEQIVERIILPK